MKHGICICYTIKSQESLRPHQNNTKYKKKNHQQKPPKENAPILNVKISKTKASYTDIPFPLDSLARNISGGVYTGPSVTLVPVIIILVSRYVNSTLFIRYHGFSWQT